MDLARIMREEDPSGAMRIVTRIALLTVLGACGSKKEPAPPPPPPRQGLEMVSVGAMPHQPLRYQLTRGVKTAVELEIDLDISARGAWRAMPTTVTVMEVGAEEALPDGNAKVRTTILRASARARPGAQTSLEAVNAQAMAMSGIEITGTLTPRGKLLGPQLAGSANLPPKASESFGALIAQADGLAMPLPEPGVGVGAIWRVRRDVIELGIKMETITELEVTAIDGPRVAYTLRNEARGDDQRATIDGVQVSVTNIRGSGGGKGVIDLGRMVSFGEQTLELGFDVAAGSESGTMKMRTAKRLKPAADPPSGAPAEAEQPAPAKDARPPAKQEPQDQGTH